MVFFNGARQLHVYTHACTHTEKVQNNQYFKIACLKQAAVGCLKKCMEIFAQNSFNVSDIISIIYCDHLKSIRCGSFYVLQWKEGK